MMMIALDHIAIETINSKMSKAVSNKPKRILLEVKKINWHFIFHIYSLVGKKMNENEHCAHWITLSDGTSTLIWIKS